jgi:hypothetical protein
MEFSSQCSFLTLLPKRQELPVMIFDTPSAATRCAYFQPDHARDDAR